ncbi:hypothetical protein P153DRAFT_360526 [Dothidotthia symphoricarpi CBS 119687]|uniref:Ca3427-like PBP 2 domain-containing protein n=1 Tax=Dothidotthia symphoricarpi CBS 119687 TaxID=1392245 RepID=A0A6A6A0R0_9PLEO|nr:uncharacterized protein P153DRAFT_360526 [Dothidotthia symphoricarpi CBS 119687]KAF2125582.1 hypothetical protein P153DRAFT_360526 [Dothidotthia symphoricarpi CBS 119687]
MSPLRIGFVPEHFSTPLAFAQKHHNLDATLLPFPSGTGHMVTALREGEIDVGVGLTEGWVAALGKGQMGQTSGQSSGQPSGQASGQPSGQASGQPARQAVGQPAGFKLIGTYVETPLCWAISTGAQREDVKDIGGLEGRTVGVSRIGSGSYVMSFVLKEQQRWGKAFNTAVLDTFQRLREGVNTGTADFFMWEHFTSKRYFDNGEIRRVGEIYTPWSSWMVVARDELVESVGGKGEGEMKLKEELDDVLDKINKGVRYFEENTEEAVGYISTQLDYSEEDAREWLKTVRFSRDVRGVDRGVVETTVGVLRKAGVLGEEVTGEGMVGLARE